MQVPLAAVGPISALSRFAEAGIPIQIPIPVARIGLAKWTLPSVSPVQFQLLSPGSGRLIC